MNSEGNSESETGVVAVAAVVPVVVATLSPLRCMSTSEDALPPPPRVAEDVGNDVARAFTEDEEVVEVEADVEVDSVVGEGNEVSWILLSLAIATRRPLRRVAVSKGRTSSGESVVTRACSPASD